MRFKTLSVFVGLGLVLLLMPFVSVPVRANDQLTCADDSSVLAVAAAGCMVRDLQHADHRQYHPTASLR